MIKKITLVRHGKTGYSGRYIGSRNVPLSTAGKKQIEEIQKYFKKSKTAKIIASPMLRCRESCEILFSEQSVIYDNDLREVDFGRWEGLTFNEIAAKDPDLIPDWADCVNTFSFPEGESVSDFTCRVHVAADRIVAMSEQNIIIVAHGGVIRALLCYFLKLNPSHYLLFKIKKGCFTTLELFSEGAVITGLNLGVE